MPIPFSRLLAEPQNLFVTGTGTEVGKTWVSCRLLEAWGRRGYQVGAMKPVACGDREDAVALQEACGVPEIPIDEINPHYYRLPASPYAAGLVENWWIDPPELAVAAQKKAESYDGFLVEGAGGWEVPFTKEHLSSDYAELLGWPVLVVADNKLGVLNHVILTVRAIEARGLTCLGVLLNHVGEERDSASVMNRQILDEALGEGTVLAEILHGEERLEAAE